MAEGALLQWREAPCVIRFGVKRPSLVHSPGSASGAQITKSCLSRARQICHVVDGSQARTGGSVGTDEGRSGDGKHFKQQRSPITDGYSESQQKERKKKEEGNGAEAARQAQVIPCCCERNHSGKSHGRGGGGGEWR